MKVKELLTSLTKLNPECDVICCCEDENLVSSRQLFKLFEITDVAEVDSKKVRSEGNLPSLKFGSEPGSEKHVIFSITSDF